MTNGVGRFRPVGGETHVYVSSDLTLFCQRPQVGDRQSNNGCSRLTTSLEASAPYLY